METDNARIHYTDTGGDGPAVLLGHGFLLDSDMFDAQAQALSPKYRLITVDARGHGRTEDAGEPFSYWDSAGDSWAVLDHLGIGEAVVGGMSQGGFTALRMALLQPDRVRALILICTVAEAYNVAQRESYRGLTDAWIGDGPIEPIAKTLGAQMIGGTDADRAPWLDKWRHGNRKLITQAANTLVDRESITDRVGEITCPAILIRGAQDQAITDEDMTALQTQLGGPAEAHTIEGASHAVNVTHSEPVNELLLNFLAGVQT
ncbi:alpha/beta hydrolase [Antrihabitans cavernicola]|uniref:Alpha/beta hydrolase n=1 Tax=Antrihabitans cavernicola TaxID=2495913 RepID=A0A5A7SK83_9NOCA|nr:alpha/beta hydrolase [Spelaeibacter cavernicola]